MSVKWQDPPEPRGGARVWGVWRERLTPLMERPGVWALVGAFHSATAGQLRHGNMKAPSGRWEFAMRRNGHTPPKADLYARYLGPEEPES